MLRILNKITDLLTGSFYFSVCYESLTRSQIYLLVLFISQCVTNPQQDHRSTYWFSLFLSVLRILNKITDLLTGSLYFSGCYESSTRSQIYLLVLFISQGVTNPQQDHRSTYWFSLFLRVLRILNKITDLLTGSFYFSGCYESSTRSQIYLLVLFISQGVTNPQQDHRSTYWFFLFLRVLRILNKITDLLTGSFYFSVCYESLTRSQIYLLVLFISQGVTNP